MRAKNELQQLSEAYQHVLLEAVNGNDIDLNADPSAQKVQKKNAKKTNCRRSVKRPSKRSRS